MYQQTNYAFQIVFTDEDGLNPITFMAVKYGPTIARIIDDIQTSGVESFRRFNVVD